MKPAVAVPVPLKSSRVVDAVPFFYGWVILGAGTLGIVMMGPSQTFTVSVFLDYLIVDLDISRSTLSLVYGLATLGASFMLPMTGRLLDRYGPRLMVFFVALGLGLACMSLSLVQGLATIFLGFLAVRFLGFGSLQMVSSNLIAQWFVRRRGRVMGLAGLSLGVTVLTFPALAEYLIGRFDWRMAWVLLGLLVWVVMLPVGWLFFRDRPELYGLRPDGETRLKAGETEPVAERSWTLAEARRTGVFWLFAIGLSAITAILAGLVFHQLSLFEVRGLSRDVAVDTFRVVALFTVVGNLSMGWLLDRYSARLLLALTLFTMVAAVVMIQVMATPFQAFVYGALQGLASGSFRVLDAVVWPKYFGRRHLGSIRGATMLGSVGGTALGPYPLGLSLDVLGSYVPVLVVLGAIPTVLGLAALWVNRPEKGAKKDA